MGFTDFELPEEPFAPAAAQEPAHWPRREEFYDRPIIDGRPVADTPLTRLRDGLRALLTSAGAREEAQLESSLRRLPGVSRTNVVATLSPKGGCGKTTTTFLAGTVLAGHLRLRALAVDLNPDFGTLADLAPDRSRAPRSLVELLRDREGIGSPGELRPYVSRLASGLHLLAAPPDPAVMAQMTPELYADLLMFLRRFYEVILLDLGTGVTAPIATFAVDHADQVVVVTTPEWITNTKVQMALGHLRLERATLVLNKVDGRAAQRATEREFRRERIAQRVAVPADLQLKTMLDSGTFSLPGLGRSTRVAIKRLGLAVGTYWRGRSTTTTRPSPKTPISAWIFHRRAAGARRALERTRRTRAQPGALPPGADGRLLSSRSRAVTKSARMMSRRAGERRVRRRLAVDDRRVVEVVAPRPRRPVGHRCGRRFNRCHRRRVEVREARRRCHILSVWPGKIRSGCPFRSAAG